jgi:hypothetical protein
MSQSPSYFVANMPYQSSYVFLSFAYKSSAYENTFCNYSYTIRQERMYGSCVELSVSDSLTQYKKDPKRKATMGIGKADVSLKKFDETIGKWILFLDDYTLEMLRLKPRPESWSLGQVYVHIMDDTKYFVEQMKDSLASSANREKEMHDTAHALFSNNAFPDILLNGPATNSNVRQPHSKDELMQNLVSIRDEVNTLYSTVDFSTSTGKTEHPGFRFFNALEWLRFAEMHMRHHFRQKKRIDDQLFT